MNYIKISEEEFYEQYQPNTNQISEDEAPFGGHMYETFGFELGYIQDHLLNDKLRKLIWTIVEGDDGSMSIVSGYHYVNRFGYMITKNPVNDGVEIEVNLDIKPDEDEG